MSTTNVYTDLLHSNKNIYTIIKQTRSVDDKDEIMIAAELRLTQLRKEI